MIPLTHLQYQLWNFALKSRNLAWLDINSVKNQKAIKIWKFFDEFFSEGPLHAEMIPPTQFEVTKWKLTCESKNDS